MEINLPQFVKLSNGGSTLRLTKDCNGYEYFVDGGLWSLDFKIIDGKIMSDSDMPSLSGLELIPITENEWRIKQGEYAPKNPPIYGYIVSGNPCNEIFLPTQDDTQHSVKNLKYLLIKR